MSNESIVSSTSAASIAPRISAQIKQSSVPLSSRAGSDAPTELDSTSTRASSVSTKGSSIYSSNLGGSTTAAAISHFQSPNRSRRQTRSTPAEHFTHGPQHLEHEYSLAYEELRSVTIYALYRLGYTNPKRRSPDEEVYIPSLATVLAAKFPDVERARKRINEADRKLKEALEKGQTWYNTPWPNYRVIFDEKGMAVDVVEVQDGDEDEVDAAEKELREVWARFETQAFKDAPGNSLSSERNDIGTKRKRGRPKRNCPDNADSGVRLDDFQRRKPEPSSSVSSIIPSSTTTSKDESAKSYASRGLDHGPPPGRRSGLRSANTIRNR